MAELLVIFKASNDSDAVI